MRTLCMGMVQNVTLILTLNVFFLALNLQVCRQVRRNENILKGKCMIQEDRHISSIYLSGTNVGLHHALAAVLCLL